MNMPASAAQTRLDVFEPLAADIQAQTPLRAAITRHDRAPEPGRVQALVQAATLPDAVLDQARATATMLVQALPAKGTRGAVEGLVREYDLSSQEGVALMCLAEALLRIPDSATRDALTRDKIGTGDWRGHVGQSASLFVNAATWDLVVTGRLTATAGEGGLGAALTRLIARGGEPVIRKGVDLAMRMMGEQFVTGQNIAEALGNARRLEARGFRYSYDMLGEAATTEADANRYYRDYETAIHAIGRAASGRGIYEGPGISIKLSALHPRYGRPQRARVMAELLPRMQALAALARRYDIGLNIDAEEADRLELSFDLLEVLCLDPALAGWSGIGFVVHAYQKRTLCAGLDRRTGPPHRPPDHAAAGEGCLLGQRDQARPGGWSRRVPGVHPQGAHRRVLPHLRAQAAGGPRRRVPAIRHPQRLYRRGDPRHGGRQLLRGAIRVPVPARHGRAAVRGGGRLQQAEPSLPHLLPGRHA